MRYLLLCFLFAITVDVRAKEIGGVDVKASIVTEKGVVLQLNGAGIRTKFIFDVYVGQLYLEKPRSATEDVLADTGQKMMVMHFVYDKVEKDKLVKGWDEGFSGNTAPAALERIAARVEEFNSFFGDIKKGEEIVLDYMPGIGTRVVFAGEEKGIIPGKDFNDALLRIWLGDKPVTKKLKRKLLGG